MKSILLFGAGKSATVLIDYLLKHSQKEQWNLVVVDANLHLAKSKTANHPNARAIAFDINNDEERNTLIKEAAIVISMLPPALHLMVAKDCVTFEKHLLTASYMDADMKSLKPEIEKKDILFLCEMGLDPGIDHMSAMQLCDRIKDSGAMITSFKSHCGGLISPESDTNPWHYKISWNPINIVNSGKMGAVYKENAEIMELDYYEVFEDCETVTVPGLNTYARYANRNSLAYIPLYGLEDTDTFIRTTLRHPDFCKGWYAVALAGLTDDSDESTINNYKGKSIQSWFHGCLNFYTKSENLGDFLNRYIDKENHELVTQLFQYLGLMTDETIPEQATTSADILRHLLVTRLNLEPHDKDMVVMLHEIEFLKNNERGSIKSLLQVVGDDSLHTAMAKTVGLPMGIATKLILNGTIQTRGLHIPIIKNIYEPILQELKENGINFLEY